MGLNAAPTAEAPMLIATPVFASNPSRRVTSISTGTSAMISSAMFSSAPAAANASEMGITNAFPSGGGWVPGDQVGILPVETFRANRHFARCLFVAAENDTTTIAMSVAAGASRVPAWGRRQAHWPSTRAPLTARDA
jgi:hypothetical protein